MEIALIADDKKKELMMEFCATYCGILSKHRLCATGKTAKYISQATGLQVESLLSGSLGGMEQMTSRVCYGEVDLLLYFKDNCPQGGGRSCAAELSKACDFYNVPLATNVATAEILVLAIENGTLERRAFVNTSSKK